MKYKDFKKMTNEDMMQILGGSAVVPKYTCHCQGCVGEWEYTDGNVASNATIKKDTELYCKTNTSWCDYPTAS